MRILEYTSLRSTNSEMARLVDSLFHGDVIVTDEQTAGRGQRGNSWEAEPGKNLTFSLFLKPEKLRAADSFLLSMAISVGIVDALNKILFPEEVTVKWPNDIYWKDLKLAGILIENSFVGPYVDYSIVGIGLNVNQKNFLSDAPNPVSMSRICGNDSDLKNVLNVVVESILDVLSLIARPRPLIERYHSSLWRRAGFHLWREPAGNVFEAQIQSVAPTGHLTLEIVKGEKRIYAFKEVFPVI